MRSTLGPHAFVVRAQRDAVLRETHRDAAPGNATLLQQRREGMLDDALADSPGDAEADVVRVRPVQAGPLAVEGLKEREDLVLKSRPVGGGEAAVRPVTGHPHRAGRADHPAPAPAP